MRTVAEHQHAVRELLAPLAGRERVTMTRFTPTALAQSRDHHRVLAEPVVSPIDLPPFDNSQMDGFAMRRADVVPGVAMPVAAPIAAGSGIRTLDAGFAAPIMTGAPIPIGADAVIPIEVATPDRFPDPAVRSFVAFERVPEAEQFVRVRGSDVAAGTLLLPAGSKLGPAQWGIVAASGVTELDFVRPVHVLVLSTGDELRPAGERLAPGQIYDSNGMSLAIALSECHASVEAVEIVPDDQAAVREVLAEHAERADLIVTTGGVSAGAYEVVRDFFGMGVGFGFGTGSGVGGVEFGSVAMQPGGPQGLGFTALDVAGSRVERPVIAFPGNPVSALVSFEMFLRPVLCGLHGLPPNRTSWSAPLAEPLVSPVGKHQVRRGRLNEAGEVELVGGPSSHLLHGYASSTLLVHIPVGVSSLEAGESVEVWSIVD